MLLKTKKVGKVCSLCGGGVLVGGWDGKEDQVPAERTLRSTKVFFDDPKMAQNTGANFCLMSLCGLDRK